MKTITQNGEHKVISKQKNKNFHIVLFLFSKMMNNKYTIIEYFKYKYSDNLKNMEKAVLK